MKKGSRVFAVALAVCLLAGLFLLPAGAETKPVDTKGLTVLFTHDTHDHFYPDANGVGGYPRLATALKNERANAHYPTITVDGGDFSMGSLFQTVYSTDAPELRALGRMGYDVVTLGNHEFDYRQKGLAEMLYAAKQSGEAIPAIVQANYTTPKDVDAGQNLTEAFVNYPVTPYTVVEKDGVKIAVFGVMGVDSDECAPMSGMVYEPMVEAAKRVVAEIREKEQPDFIICLSHGGTDSGKGEDYELAKAVDGIDLIVSGHTHTTLEEPIVVNGTPIVSCGPYTQNLGSITLKKLDAEDEQFTFEDYRLIPIDGSIRADRELETLAERFKQKVDSSYLSDYNMSYDGVLTVAESDFTIPQTGDFIGEAYLETVRKVEGYYGEAVAFAVVPDGVIRGTLAKGEVTTSQAFDILSLGSGADGSPGYPLVSVYLTGRDLKNVFEVDASISALMPAATLYGAGCGWIYNPNRMFLDKVTSVHIYSSHGSGSYGTPKDDQLYRVVADLYSGQMLAAVKEKSFGLLSITPRDKDGNPITDFEQHIIRDSQGRELKAWQAFADYLNDQESVAPAASLHKAVKPSLNPIDPLIPMGAPTAVLVILILLVILVAALLIRRAVRKGKRKGYHPYTGKK